MRRRGRGRAGSGNGVLTTTLVPRVRPPAAAAAILRAITTTTTTTDPRQRRKERRRRRHAGAYASARACPCTRSCPCTCACAEALHRVVLRELHVFEAQRPVEDHRLAKVEVLAGVADARAGVRKGGREERRKGGKKLKKTKQNGRTTPACTIKARTHARAHGRSRFFFFWFSIQAACHVTDVVFLRQAPATEICSCESTTVECSLYITQGVGGTSSVRSSGGYILRLRRFTRRREDLSLYVTPMYLPTVLERACESPPYFYRHSLGIRMTL